jgi:taurine dioxygenase
MSSLSGKHGPRYRHVAGEAEPYETIAVEKLTPIIGAEISGVDIGSSPTMHAPTARWTRSIVRSPKTS